MATNQLQTSSTSAAFGEVHEHAVELARHRRAITKRLRRKQTDMRLEALASLADIQADHQKLSAPAPAR